MVGGDDHGRVQARRFGQERVEGLVQTLQQAQRMTTVDAVLVRDRIVVGVVSIDVAALVREAQAVQRAFEELLERGVAAQLRAVAVRAIVDTGKDALWRNGVGADRKTLEEGS